MKQRVDDYRKENDRLNRALENYEKEKGGLNVY